MNPTRLRTHKGSRLWALRGDSHRLSLQGLWFYGRGSLFLPPSRKEASRQRAMVATALVKRFLPGVQLLEEAEEEILADVSFPAEHGRPLYSTYPLERMHKETKPRGEVVGSFPRRPSLMRRAGSILAEQDDEWAVRRCDQSQESMKKLCRPDEEVTTWAYPLAQAIAG